MARKEITKGIQFGASSLKEASPSSLDTGDWAAGRLMGGFAGGWPDMRC